MKCLTSLFTVFLLAATVPQVPAAEPQLAHMVFFTLAEDTPANREALVAACQKYLSDHDGTVYFSAGAIADDLDREVNDRDFDVALHLVFANRAAHDTYQTHPQHLKFIDENKHLWASVRVFDSYLPTASVDSYPSAAKGFAGMLRGEVVSKDQDALVVAVREITNVWRHSKAEQPKSLVGKRVLVKAADGAEQATHFIQLAEVGESLKLDVGNQSGDALVILELTEDQRERVKQ